MVRLGRRCHAVGNAAR